MKPEALLFDMDGTLTDSEQLWFAAEARVFSELGVEWKDGDQKDIIGMAIPDSTRVLVDRYQLSIEPKELATRLIDAVVDVAIERGMPWRPGAYEALQLAVALDIPTALVTSSYRKFANQTLANAPEGALSVVVSGDVLAPDQGKPHPEPYLRAARELGVDITRCVIFEDSIPGLESGIASGARVVAIPFEVDLPQRDDVIYLDSLERLDEEFLHSVLQ